MAKLIVIKKFHLVLFESINCDLNGNLNREVLGVGRNAKEEHPGNQASSNGQVWWNYYLP